MTRNNPNVNGGGLPPSLHRESSSARRCTRNCIDGSFPNGLKDDIGKEIQVLEPYNMKQAMDPAVWVEDRVRM